jgi:hypothetical protein
LRHSGHEPIWASGEEKVMMPIAPNEYFLDPLMSRKVVSQEQFFRNIQRYGECIEKLFKNVRLPKVDTENPFYNSTLPEMEQEISSPEDWRRTIEKFGIGFEETSITLLVCSFIPYHESLDGWFCTIFGF